MRRNYRQTIDTQHRLRLSRIRAAACGLLATFSLFAQFAAPGNMLAVASAVAADSSAVSAPVTSWTDANSIDAWRVDALMRQASVAPAVLTCAAGKQGIRIGRIVGGAAYDVESGSSIWAPDAAHADLMAQDVGETRALRKRLAPRDGGSDRIVWTAALNPGQAYVFFCYPKAEPGDSRALLAGPASDDDRARTSAPAGLRSDSRRGAVPPTMMWYAGPGALASCEAVVEGGRYDYDADGQIKWTGAVKYGPVVCRR